jgi:hypothetical protein
MFYAMGDITALRAEMVRVREDNTDDKFSTARAESLMVTEVASAGTGTRKLMD